MRTKLLATFFLAIFLAGCATTRKGQNIQMQQLQNRINYLEAELEQKNQEISSLEGQLGGAKDFGSELSKKKRSSTTHLSVKQIQTALKNAGFYRGLVDGKMGPKTKEAIRTFQQANGLKADGIAGKRTIAELNGYLK